MYKYLTISKHFARYLNMGLRVGSMVWGNLKSTSPIYNMKCYHPQVYNDNTVACGRCPACRQNRINGWVVRLEKHQRHQESAHFITLTYGEDQCDKTKNGLLTLNKDHLKQFFKRLRNLHHADYQRKIKRYEANKGNQPFIQRPKEPGQITYYAAGEYGSKTSRPHYHIIIFNTDVNLISSAWSSKDKFGHWRNRGNIHQGNTSGGSVRYTLKYISKPSRIPLFSGDDRTPEFSNCSQGIGKSYLTPAAIRWHREDIVNRYYIPTNGGGMTTIPRYYAEKIYSKAERAEIGVHLELKSSSEFYKNLITDTKFLHNYVTSIKWQEKKAFTPKVYKL